MLRLLSLACLLGPLCVPLVTGSATAQAPAVPALSALFDSAPVPGEPANLQISSADAPGVGPVSGVEVDFGSGDDAVGASACALDAAGVPVPAVAGRAYDLTIAHAFPAQTPRRVQVTLRWGGCGAPAVSRTELLDVTPAPAPPATPATDPPHTIFPGLPALPALDGALPRQTATAVAAARCRGADRIPRPGNLERSVDTTRCLLNSVRRASGVRSLHADLRLRRAARQQNLDMRHRRFFAHASGNGPDLGGRMRRARYYPYRFVGENLGGGTGIYTTPRNMVRAWLASPGHRENVLQPRFRDFGVSIVEGWPPRGHRRGATYTVEYGVRARR